MRDTIYTIPIDEVLEPKCGCPICRMRDTLEERALEYTMGAAMMEPDVRIEMNRLGFCERHLGEMLQRKNRLSVALILQSHLGELQEGVLQAKAPLLGADKRSQRLQQVEAGCFVCHRIEESLSRMVDTILNLWHTEPDFKGKFIGQESLCLPHYTRLFLAAGNKLKKAELKAFQEVIGVLAANALDPIKADIDSFCDLFDYRQKPGIPIPEEVRSAPERAFLFLSGRTPVEQ